MVLIGHEPSVSELVARLTGGARAAELRVPQGRRGPGRASGRPRRRRPTHLVPLPARAADARRKLTHRSPCDWRRRRGRGPRERQRGCPLRREPAAHVTCADQGRSVALAACGRVGRRAAAVPAPGESSDGRPRPRARRIRDSGESPTEAPPDHRPRGHRHRDRPALWALPEVVRRVALRSDPQGDGPVHQHRRRRPQPLHRFLRPEERACRRAPGAGGVPGARAHRGPAVAAVARCARRAFPPAGDRSTGGAGRARRTGRVQLLRPSGPHPTARSRGEALAVERHHRPARAPQRPGGSRLDRAGVARGRLVDGRPRRRPQRRHHPRRPAPGPRRPPGPAWRGDPARRVAGLQARSGRCGPEGDPRRL